MALYYYCYNELHDLSSLCTGNDVLTLKISDLNNSNGAFDVLLMLLREFSQKNFKKQLIKEFMTKVEKSVQLDKICIR